MYEEQAYRQQHQQQQQPQPQTNEQSPQNDKNKPSSNNNYQHEKQHYQYDPDRPLEGFTNGGACCLLGVLEGMTTWISDILPLRERQTTTTTVGGKVKSNSGIGMGARFGDVAFREWHARLERRLGAIVTEILECGSSSTSLSPVNGISHEKAEHYRSRGRKVALMEPPPSASSSVASASSSAASASIDNNKTSLVLELSSHLSQSFGHPVRLDYGTGHESSFLIFMMCLAKVGALVGVNDNDEINSNVKF